MPENNETGQPGPDAVGMADKVNVEKQEGGVNPSMTPNEMMSKISALEGELEGVNRLNDARGRALQDIIPLAEANRVAVIAEKARAGLRGNY
jgi:hypothetical protein